MGAGGLSPKTPPSFPQESRCPTFFLSSTLRNSEFRIKMAKRFTDSEKWKKNWFRKLPNDMKLFWVYICDNCNIAGIWDVDFELASFFIGNEMSEMVVLRYMEKQILVLNDSKWLIKDFVCFQYGVLTPNNNLHRSVLNLLNNSGASQGLTSPLAGDKVKVKDKVIKDGIVKGNQFDFDSIWNQYPRRIGRKAAELHFSASIKIDQDYSNLKLALENYIIYIKGKDPQYIMHGSTWFNNWRDWMDMSVTTGKSQAFLDLQRMANEQH